jgi:hypothetical protein
VLRARRIAAAAIAAVLLTALDARAGVAATAGPPATDDVESQSLDFLIYNPSNMKLIGRGHYTVAVTRDSVAIEGDNHYFDGEYDVEHERLRATGTDPVLVSYEHSFFDTHGAPQRIARADPMAGQASCTSYPGGEGSVASKVLQFPADTYAGASVLVPIADQLKLKLSPSGNLHFHVFDCASGPRIFSLRVDMRQALWNYLPRDNDLVKANARPVFGWFDVFLKPFVPETQFWFDPRQNFGFMGGMLSRYYRGPEVMLVRIPAPLAAPPLHAATPAAMPKVAESLIPAATTRHPAAAATRSAGSAAADTAASQFAGAMGASDAAATPSATPATQ